jgi:hypothetical protein
MKYMKKDTSIKTEITYSIIKYNSKFVSMNYQYNFDSIHKKFESFFPEDTITNFGKDTIFIVAFLNDVIESTNLVRLAVDKYSDKYQKQLKDYKEIDINKIREDLHNNILSLERIIKNIQN